MAPSFGTQTSHASRLSLNCETQLFTDQKLSSSIFPCSFVRPTKRQKDPTCGIFLKRGLFKDVKNDIPMCQTCKYKNTNTQIHKYSIWRSARKTQHVAYFWKEDCSRISKMIFPCVKHANTKIQIRKYTITQMQHTTKCQEDPACGIFLKRGLFKDIKNYSHMSQTCKYKNTNTQNYIPHN